MNTTTTTTSSLPTDGKNILETLRELRQRLKGTQPEKVLFQFPGAMRDFERAVIRMLPIGSPLHPDLRWDSVSPYNTLYGLMIYEDTPRNRVLVGDPQCIEEEVLRWEPGLSLDMPIPHYPVP